MLVKDFEDEELRRGHGPPVPKALNQIRPLLQSSHKLGPLAFLQREQ